MRRPPLSMRLTALFTSLAVAWTATGALAQSPAKPTFDLQPQDLPKRGSAEYFSTIPSQKLLMTINIWGDVAQPGIHLVPKDATIAAGLSAAGGPSALSDFPNVVVVRDGKNLDVDLLEQGNQFVLQGKDTVYVPRSFKSDLPLYFGAVSTIVSMLTLYYVTKNRD